MENEKLIRLFILIIIAGAAGVVVYYSSNPYTEDSVDSSFRHKKSPEKSGQLEVTKAPAGDLISSFPKEIPINSNTEIKESYSADYHSTAIEGQSTVAFTSSKSAETNFDFYLKWAMDGGWTIINSQRKPPVYSIYLKKTGETINITIHNSSVTISYVKLKQ